MHETKVSVIFNPIFIKAIIIRRLLVLKMLLFYKRGNDQFIYFFIIPLYFALAAKN